MVDSRISPMQQHLIAGTLGGFVATGGLYPLELIKTRMQVAGENHKPYRSLTKACQTVFKNEGIKGFYQGVTPALFAASGSWGGYFFFYEKSKERKLAKLALFESSNSNSNNISKLAKLGTVDHLTSGVEAGAILVFIFNPVWVVKTRLALQGVDLKQQTKYTGPVDALRKIAREEGLRGLYKGLVPALFLTSHGAIQFACYEYLKDVFEKLRVISKQSNEQPAYISAAIGGGSKIIASVVTYPYQVVKSKLQQTDILHVESNTYQAKYTSTWDCAKKIWRNERIIGFYRGVVPNSLKVAPSASITFLVYEETMKYLKALDAKT